MRLCRDANLLERLRKAGQQEARQRFSVMAAATKLEAGFHRMVLGTTKQRSFRQGNSKDVVVKKRGVAIAPSRRDTVQKTQATTISERINMRNLTSETREKNQQQTLNNYYNSTQNPILAHQARNYQDPTYPIPTRIKAAVTAATRQLQLNQRLTDLYLQLSQKLCADQSN